MMRMLILLETSLSISAINTSKDTIRVGSDMNVPDIDWEENTITGNQYKKVINELLKSTIDDAGLGQVVNFPTRGQNILDIVATNRPSLVATCKPIRGVSDHEIVYVESRVFAKHQRPIQHKICLWKKADIINLKSDILDAVRTFIEINTISTNINSLWEHFSKTCQELVPYKMASVKYSQAWINIEIKTFQEEKKAYNKAKESRKTKDGDHYKSIKTKCQIKCHKTYNNYISTMLNNDIQCQVFIVNHKKQKM